MLENAKLIVVAAALLIAGGVFFLTITYAIKCIFHEFGWLPALVSGVAQIIVWLGIAAMFDKRHPTHLP